LMWKNTKNH